MSQVRVLYRPWAFEGCKLNTCSLFCSFYVKDCGMGEKKEGKENKKCSTMPDVLIKGYKILRTVSVGQDFSLAEVEHKQSGIPDCLWGQHQREWILMKDAA